MSEIESAASGICAMAVMAKASIPGRAKTRLVPPLSGDHAAELNTAFLRDIAANLLRAGQLTQIHPWMAYAPAGSEPFFRSMLPDAVRLLETVAPSLGDCLLSAMSTLLAHGYQSVCLLNSDSPTLPTAYLVTAATALAADGERMVIGPSTDGGYYLIGLKRVHRRLFEDIEWSTDRVFEQTMARAAEIGFDVLVLPTWYDVDEVETLRTLVDEVMDDRPFRVVRSGPATCEHTRRVLAGLLRDAAITRSLAGQPSTADCDGACPAAASQDRA